MAENHNGSVFDVEKSEENFNLLSSFRKLGELEFTKDFMLLNPIQKDKVEAIPYPKDRGNVAAWEYDALISNKATLITFAPEIQKPQIYKLMTITELPNNQLSISGMGNFTVGEKAYYAFRVIVDKKSLPVVVEENNLYYYGEYPAAYSPDGQLALIVTLIPDEEGLAWPYNTQWTLKDINGQGIRTDYKFSQFEGLSKIRAGVSDLSRSNAHLFLSGIAFYWQP